MPVDLSKQEYLKRYLSGDVDKDGKKKRKKKKSSQTKPKKLTSNFKIIDTDADVPIGPPKIDDDDVEEIDNDDEPEVKILNTVTIDELKLMGKFKADSWKTTDKIKKEIKEEVEDENEGRARRHDSSSEDDASPPRPRRYDSDSESDDRQQNHKNRPPPHEKASTSKGEGLSTIKQEPIDDDDDFSPPRRQRQGSADEQSPPRRRGLNDDTDQSPPRRPPPQGTNDIDSDISPPRKRGREGSSDDQSPPRAGEKTAFKMEMAKKSDKMRKTLSGASAGLQSASQLKKEALELKKREDEMFKKLGDSVSGRNAETQMRRHKREMTEAKAKADEEKKKKQEELKKKYEKWNKGVKQLKDREDKLEDMSREVNKPVARYEGDDDLEIHLKNIEHSDDPMLAYMRNKQTKKAVAQGKKMYPEYKGPLPAPNRFGIKPGYRWDGVDRSNGFEARLFETKNTKKAEDEELYRYQAGMYE